VPIALSFKPFIPFPAVGDHHGSWLNGVFHKGSKAACGSVLDATQPNTPHAISIYLGCNHHECFVPKVPATSARLDSANIGFIHFDLASEAVSTRPYHGSSEFL
jgi:hypothetical protein